MGCRGHVGSKRDAEGQVGSKWDRGTHKEIVEYRGIHGKQVGQVGNKWDTEGGRCTI